MKSVRNKNGSISKHKVERKHGKDPMYRLLDRLLEISFAAARKKTDDPTGYLLAQLRKEGFEVTYKKPQPVNKG